MAGTSDSIETLARTIRFCLLSSVGVANNEQLRQTYAKALRLVASQLDSGEYNDRTPFDQVDQRCYSKSA